MYNFDIYALCMFYISHRCAKNTMRQLMINGSGRIGEVNTVSHTSCHIYNNFAVAWHGIVF